MNGIHHSLSGMDRGDLMTENIGHDVLVTPQIIEELVRLACAAQFELDARNYGRTKDNVDRLQRDLRELLWEAYDHGGVEVTSSRYTLEDL